MPTAVMAQPIRMARGPAPAAIFCGRLNTPEPTIEPITNAVREPTRSFVAAAAVTFPIGTFIPAVVMDALLSLKISMEGNEQEKAAGNFDAGQTDFVA
ncbi:hypothetical protein GCM10010869_03990 [Mesorhizobium tianshanense]|nr:hypothetical protein GCM10010869_03990 [Mesorhizobium tianshanense]